MARLPENPQATLFEQTLSNLCLALTSLIIVHRPEFREHFHEVSERARLSHPKTDITLVEFENAESGMGASLACGAKHIDGWDAALVCLADMPYILPSTYSLVARSVGTSSLVVPYYNEARGHPIAFGSIYFDELRALTGDSGARVVLEKHRAKIFTLAVDDGGILIDIDTQEDLDKRL